MRAEQLAINTLFETFDFANRGLVCFIGLFGMHPTIRVPAQLGRPMSM